MLGKKMMVSAVLNERKFDSNHHDCRIISRNLNEEKISRGGNPDIKAGRKSRFMLEVSEKAFEKLDNLIA
jgi:hypothetical protein